MQTTPGVHRLWKNVVEPVLEAARPRRIVEVGAGRGKNTVRLLDYCRREGAVCEVVDPAPEFDIGPLVEEYADLCRYHDRLSVDVLGEIPTADVVLIDGDHNWFTVFHELELLGKRAEKDDRPFPIVLLHDVGWPYGRRDLYYAPETIPAAHRHPHERAGMRPGSTGLVEDGGFNRSAENAVTEGGERNGVFTAIEDFLSGAGAGLQLVVVPGIHGLAVLYSKEAVERKPGLRRTIESFSSSEFLYRQCELVEKRRVREAMRASDLRREVKRLRKRVEKLEHVSASGGRGPRAQA